MKSLRSFGIVLVTLSMVVMVVETASILLSVLASPRSIYSKAPTVGDSLHWYWVPRA